MDARLVDDVKRAESLGGAPALAAYRDSLGYWTAGWGHLLDQSRNWTGVVFPEELCDLWLNGDLLEAQVDAHGLAEWGALDTPCRQNAMIELIFNMGLEHWEEFRNTRAAISAKNWQAAHDGLLDSLWAREVQPQGFGKPGRATRLAGYLLTGMYPT